VHQILLGVSSFHDQTPYPTRNITRPNLGFRQNEGANI
jgi:hypothetical protein